MAGTTFGNADYRGITLSPDERVVFAASLGNYLHAIDAESGVLVWHKHLNDDVYSTPVVSKDGRTVYIGSDAIQNNRNPRPNFWALNTTDGIERWSFQASGKIGSTTPQLSPDGSTVYLASARGASGEHSGHTVYALNTADGSVRWKSDAPANDVASGQ